MIPDVTSRSAFVGATLAVAAGWSVLMDVFLRNRLRIQRRISESLSGNGDKDPGLLLFKDLKGFLAESRQSGSVWQSFVLAVEQSGLDIAAERLVVIAAGSGALLGFVVAFILGPGLVSLLAAACAATVPVVVVYGKRSARMRRLCEQLPDAFDLMSRAVRSGQTMPSAMQLVADSVQQPLSAEFALCCEQQNLGLPPAIALRDMARRTGVFELQFFVTAILIQRLTGGSPVDVLNSLASIIRKRVRLRSKVRALTAEGRLQAIVLAVLPLAAFVALYFLNRSYAEVLLARPSMLAAILASQTIGMVWIRRVINFDY
jgi:tight adherence protein B